MQIGIDTGRKEIEIVRDGENVGSIWFSPADPALLGRLKEVRKKAEAIQAGMEIDHDDLDAALEEATRVDREMRSVLDWAFGYPVSDVVFGDSYSFTSAEGVSALEQFLQGVVPYISSEIKKETSAAEAHRARYLDKYK